MPNLTVNKEITSLFLGNIYVYYKTFWDRVGIIIIGKKCLTRSLTLYSGSFTILSSLLFAMEAF